MSDINQLILDELRGLHENKKDNIIYGNYTIGIGKLKQHVKI